MVAFSFKPEFVPKILSGEKLSTIRSTRRCNVGDTMHLYTGLRTKKCKKLMDVVCIGVATIVVSAYSLWKLGETEGNVRPSAAPLHEQEGFANVKDMIDFFRQQYGLPYRGYIHAWRKTMKKSQKTCQYCGHVGDDVRDIGLDAPYPMPSDYMCDACAEKEWDRQQERMMENG